LDKEVFENIFKRRIFGEMRKKQINKVDEDQLERQKPVD
jgi:hypothetical protein